MGLGSRLTSAWNAFNEKDKQTIPKDLGYGSGRPRSPLGTSFSRDSIANTVFNRIALDASMVDILHVKMDRDTGNQTKLKSSLETCLTDSANIDQTGAVLIHDIVYSMMDEGTVAVVPVDTSVDIKKTDSYEIYSLRVGKITQWYPSYIRVNLYNDRTGNYEEVILPKSDVAIITNPLYEIVNKHNGLLDRLVRKMALIDQADELTVSDKLNMIMQLPYAIRGQKRKEQAEQRLQDLESQLQKSQYGIGYVDASEKITQLSRPINNNLGDEIKYLTEQFYNALGLTQNVFNGTASEIEMRAYYNRTVDPIMMRICSEFTRKFLTKTARTQGQRMVAYRDPFKLVPVEQLATIADTFSRNAILTPNEIRGIVGFGPNADPEADKLANRNIADVNQQTAGASTTVGPAE